MYSSLTINTIEQFVYARSPKPVTTRRGVEIGSGTIFPEVNFTLPTMDITEATWPQVVRHYTEMVDGVIARAVELEVPQLLVEFETLPAMTLKPEWSLEITRLLADRLEEAHRTHGQKNALRFTPNDIREFARPPQMRSGIHWENMVRTFAAAGEAGADLLAIESTGGKEICDEALMTADLPRVVFALGVLGCRDMAFLWDHIVAVCNATGVIPAGDSACGFANTAMVLAEQKMIPAVLAAVVRVTSVPRTLVAHERGAVGPSKDCAYEGPYLKAIAGIPISLEGKSAACAHFSPIGNIAAAVADCWSNESVQNVQLLSGKAPMVSTEQLAYDCRLMNVAARRSDEDALRLRDWLVESDAALDPQAYVLAPEVVLRIAERIVAEETPYTRTRVAAAAAIDELQNAAERGLCAISERERPWLDMMEAAIAEVPESEEEMIALQIDEIDPAVCDLSQYEL